MANLPRAVQQQVDAAEALLAQANQPAEATQGEPAPTDAAPAPQVEPTATSVAPEPQPAPAPSGEETWEARYKSLNGLFRAEVPKLQQQNKQLVAQLQELQERLDKQSQKPAQPEPEPTPVADPRDVETFGQDLVEMVQRQTQAVLGRVAGKLDSVVASIEQRLSHLEQVVNGTKQTVAVTAEEMFFSKLAQAVPDWEQINANDAFLAWLADADPVYGVPRQNALSAAQQALDVARVAAVFNAFKATTTAKPAAAASLAKQVSPRSTGAPAPSAPEKPVITQGQISTFYREVAQGKYRGREAEAQQLENAINEALAEGRVR